MRLKHPKFFLSRFDTISTLILKKIKNKSKDKIIKDFLSKIFLTENGIT